jgi:O-antigen ligase
LLLGWVVIATGSRAALLMTVAGGFLILIGASRGLARNLGIALVVGLMLTPLLVLGGLEVASDVDTTTAQPRWKSGGERIQREFLKDTRSRLWKKGLQRWEEQPILGIGWYSVQNRSASVMSLYLQVLIECGIIGALLFVAWLLYLLRKTYRLMLRVTTWPKEYRVCAWLAIGCTVGLLIHGVAESSILLGTTANPLLFSFSIVMIERLPILLRAAQANAARAA